MCTHTFFPFYKTGKLFLPWLTVLKSTPVFLLYHPLSNHHINSTTLCLSVVQHLLSFFINIFAASCLCPLFMAAESRARGNVPLHEQFGIKQKSLTAHMFIEKHLRQ